MREVSGDRLGVRGDRIITERDMHHQRSKTARRGTVASAKSCGEDSTVVASSVATRAGMRGAGAACPQRHHCTTAAWPV
jgi:hypothetical protein